MPKPPYGQNPAKRPPCADGRDAKTSLLIRGAYLLNVFSGETERADVLVKDGVIAGVGGRFGGEAVVELGGRFLIPGLIDAHMHVESTLLTPEGYSELAALHGTTTSISDPHEVVNVAGLDGFLYMVEASEGLPMDILYTVPSCVPATRMETNGADFGLEEMERAFALYPETPGLSEFMDYPSVVEGRPEALAKIALARSRGKLVDGHCPGLTGPALDAYIAAGISSEHECTSLEEAREKLGRGMFILIREGSCEKNLDALLGLAGPSASGRCAFATDDRSALDLVMEGGVDYILRRAVQGGLDPATAVRMATINPATHYRLYGRGAIAPGYAADIVAVEDLESFPVTDVFKGGRHVVKDGALLAHPLRKPFSSINKKVNIPDDIAARLKLALPPGKRARVMRLVPGQIGSETAFVPASELPSRRDILKAAVIERHRGTGNVGIGLIQGMGPVKGALASTVAHDSHNLVVAGSDDQDMAAAALRVATMGGGMAVVSGGRVLAELPLPLAGLMSDRGADEVAGTCLQLGEAAASIGCKAEAPFMALSFIALPVVPELKLTDMGLVDVRGFTFVGLWEDT